MNNTASANYGSIPAERAALARGAKAAGSKFLTFRLAGEEYGIEILKIQEIIGLLKITPVPKSPEFVAGVINLRGKIILTLDLRLKLSLPAAEPACETCIIIVKIPGLEAGLIVDRVSEVACLSPADIEDPGVLGYRATGDWFLGVGKAPGRLIFLLNIEKIIEIPEAVTLYERAQAVTEG